MDSVRVPTRLQRIKPTQSSEEPASTPWWRRNLLELGHGDHLAYWRCRDSECGAVVGEVKLCAPTGFHAYHMAQLDGRIGGVGNNGHVNGIGIRSLFWGSNELIAAQGQDPHSVDGGDISSGGLKINEFDWS